MDKSTFQGLNADCLLYISRYFQHRLSPILLREITSDLAKQKDESESKFKTVSRLAARALLSQSSVLPDALVMASNELLFGNFIPMNGYMAPREGAIAIDVPDLGRGFFFDEHPMIATLRDWADECFASTDLQKAMVIRDEDSSINLVTLFQEFERDMAIPQFKFLKEMVDWIDKVWFSCSTYRSEILRVARHILQDQPGLIGMVMRRWRREGRPEPRYFAPYSMYFHRVEVIHNYSLLCGFVRRSKKGKAHLDIQYLYYLPFCHIFSSDDKDLIKLVPFFIKPDQVFVSKENLQQDLKRLSAYFSGLSDDEMKIFYNEYGFYPPDLENSFTSNMWKKFMRPRQPQEGKLSHPSPEEEAEIMKELKKIQEAIEKQKTQSIPK